MTAAAVGLDQVGGVGQGAQRNLAVQEDRGAMGRAGSDWANTVMTTDAGPEARTRAAKWMNNASGSNVSANHSAEYDVKKVMGERQAVQGTEEAVGVEAPIASSSESLVPNLNRAI